MPQKAVNVVVELHLRAITCPGVHLPAKDDVYLSVSLMSQYRKSECLPAVFPILIREKICFRKMIIHPTDPGDIADFLDCEAVKIELIQLTPPAGEILASFEENAQSFLFPEPKLVPSFSGVEREVLMTRHPSFPGICPRLEFSTKTIIREICSEDDFLTLPKKLTRKTFRKSRNKASSHRHGDVVLDQFGFKVPGSLDCSGRNVRFRSLSPVHPSKPSTTAGTPRRRSSRPQIPDEDSSETDDLLDYAEEVSRHHSLMGPDGSSPPRHARIEHPRHNGLWEEVQERLRCLLTSPKAIQRLARGATDSEIDDVLMRRRVLASSCPF